ncbi:MAG: serine hydrolase [Candidatus Gastranaerophilales bacterium]|nr:serine hydrolase [Candidatus Gastranaerophilales bacterium]
MPKQSYKYNTASNMYTSVYEQYYFKNTPKKVKPIRRTKKKKSASKIKTLFFTICFILLLFYILPFSFKNFVADTVKINAKTILNVDYHHLMYPTQSYLNKDLFLGKYIIKEAEYKNSIMIDIPETGERKGLKNRLLALANEYSKIEPSVYVWEYGGRTFVDINADKPYPAASIIKLPVLIEMFREIEAGKFSLYDKMVLEDFYRASGSGKLQYSQGGRAHTMDYLAKIMIENSDNSSTNMIISKIGGMHEVNKAMKRWGLKTTHINTWLPDLDGTNITTARELAKMLYNIDTTNIVSNTSKRHMADYLGHVKNNRLLQAGLPSDALLLHKTGDIGDMLGDAGLVKTANGKKYIVAILAKRPYNNRQGKDFIVKASEIIYNNISM